MQRGQGAAAGPIDGDGTLFHVGCASTGVDRNRFPRTLNRTSVENSDGTVRVRKIRARKKKMLSPIKITLLFLTQYVKSTHIDIARIYIC